MHQMLYSGLPSRHTMSVELQDCRLSSTVPEYPSAKQAAQKTVLSVDLYLTLRKTFQPPSITQGPCSKKRQ